MSLESWDEHIDLWLKPETFKQVPADVEVSDVIEDTSDSKTKLILKIKYDGSIYSWEPNTTNKRKLVSLGVKQPKEVVDRTITFTKIKVQNPSTKQQVDSLLIDAIN